jgi:ATP-dependent RNA helicase DeaD
MAATFVSGRDIYKIQFLERFTHSRIRRGSVPTPGEVEEKRSDKMIGRVRDLLEQGSVPDQSHLTDRLMEEGYQATEICSALFSLLLGDPAPDQASVALRQKMSDEGGGGEPDRDSMGEMTGKTALRKPNPSFSHSKEFLQQGRGLRKHFPKDASRREFRKHPGRGAKKPPGRGG